MIGEEEGCTSGVPTYLTHHGKATPTHERVENELLCKTEEYSFTIFITQLLIRVLYFISVTSTTKQHMSFFTQVHLIQFDNNGSPYIVHQHIRQQPRASGFI